MNQSSTPTPPQTSFSLDFRFTSKCVHCGKPMARMEVDRYESVGPGQVEERRVAVMWIDPSHECDYLNIAPKTKETG